ncbi:unnamed protein product [Lepeophtheirus salmonis]|uniref:(salmon louse) hypothetical protein n=1 Tax=Lepeophtheirus salmonis TaxID=72036 RepID=A0A7R8CFQ3_LEPSM|nr:unnamed protein product [Lepeophtheirus salmonis]CAF2808679.1 unnamed protein product [Lepeophtheirus salmonis]
MSSQSQNEMIDILGTEIQRMIINDSHAAGMFGISANTAVVTRYVKNMTLNEGLLALKHVKSKIEEDTAKGIISVISNNQLNTTETARIDWTKCAIHPVSESPE